MKYTTEQINKALELVKNGYTHEQAARKTKMKVFSINYYLARKPKTTTPTTATAPSSYKTVIRETIQKLEALL